MHENALTGVGTALVTPFTHVRRARRGGGPAARPAADRRRRPLPGAVRHDRREPDADATPSASASSRSWSRRRTAQVPVLAGAGGYDTREVIHLADEMRQGRRGRAAVGDAVLQQADAGRALPALSRRSPRARRCRSSSTTCPGRTGVNIEPATLARLAAIPNIVGVKEASGNITQMCEVCRAVPADFLVLSGDDALTLPLMAIGGRGVISVASNEIPAEMVQMVEAAERGDFAAARADARPAPAADAGQLRRVEPGAGEGRDGGDGPARGGLPAADVPAAAGVEGEDRQGAEGARPVQGALV